MKYLSKLQKVLLCVGLVFIVAALFGAPKYWDYCEIQALKAKFAEFADVDHWPESMEIRMNSHTLKDEDADRVKAAIAKLEFGGKFDEKDYVDSMFTGSGMLGSVAFSALTKSSKDPKAWFVAVCEDGVYCYEPRHGFAMKNSAELYQVMEEMAVRYPYR